MRWETRRWAWMTLMCHPFYEWRIGTAFQFQFSVGIYMSIKPELSPWLWAERVCVNTHSHTVIFFACIVKEVKSNNKGGVVWSKSLFCKHTKNVENMNKIETSIQKYATKSFRFLHICQNCHHVWQFFRSYRRLTCTTKCLGHIEKNKNK